MKFVIGDISQLKSWTLYTAIDNIDSLEAPISLKQFPGVRSKLELKKPNWLGNATLLNERSDS